MILLQGWRLTSDPYGLHPTLASYDLLPLKNENCCVATWRIWAQAKLTIVHFQFFFPQKLYCPELQRDAICYHSGSSTLMWCISWLYITKKNIYSSCSQATSFEEILPTCCWHWDLILCVAWPGSCLSSQGRFIVVEELKVWCLQVPPASAGWSRDVLRSLARKLGWFH